MFAVIRDRSKQYMVKPGDTLEIDLKEGVEPGQQLVFDEVLMIGGTGKKDIIGKPTVAKAQVLGEVARPLSPGKKVHIVKWTRREQYQRHVGHRQKFTTVKITEIKV